MKKWLFSYLSFTVILLCTACHTAEDTNSDQELAEETTTESSEEDSYYPVDVTDSFGNVITFEEKPERIVSLMPSNTEIAYALGLGDRIVGVTDFCTYPEEAQEKPSVGGLDFDLEKVIAFNPDLVLAHASSAETYEDAFQQIENNGANVLIVNEANSFEDAYESMKMIGQATNKEEEANAIIQEIEENVQAIADKSAQIEEEDKKTVWIEIEPAPSIWTTGKGTFMHEMIETINAYNAAGDQEGWLEFSEEKAVSLQPDVILTMAYGMTEDEAIAEINSRPGWETVPAVQNQEIYQISEDIVSRPGPRLIQGITELADSVYPDVFREE